MTFTKIDRKAAEIMRALAEATVYKKQGRVQARKAVLGEQYIISEKKFFGRYEATDESGVYAAKGYCRAIKNPFGYSIEIMASWGEPQTGDENCMIADTCDADGNVDGEPYLIEAKAFAETYKPVQ